MTPEQLRHELEDVQGMQRGDHLEYLLDQACLAFEDGRDGVGVTHLADAVRVSILKNGPVDAERVMQFLRRVMDAGGALA